ncbi:MAG TPA: NAD(P)H-dependent oxidoreductase [Candidatus Sulfotelmatobacter sp.]|nr:NAD(P)H-dependent oxidoreductase [Candidatus Sulfotelmatobacter sp.]
MKLAVIVGSTRPNRQTPKQAKWAVNSAKEIEGIEAELVDLIDYPMPFFNEPISPRYNTERKIDPDVKKWLDKLTEFDAYLFVTPEYNHSITGVLKNALDYVTWEIQRKPAAVISHGSNGGARAATDLKEILSESQAAVVPASSALSISGMSDKIDEDGNLDTEIKANAYGPQGALTRLLNDLKWYSDALAPARAKLKPGF